MTENPFQPPVVLADVKQQASESMASTQVAYNVVSDTVTGVNVRWSDNRFQAIFVFVSMVAIAMLGALLTLLNSQQQLPWYAGALMGAFVGMVFGVFGSGIYLMIYRAYRHLKGKHD